MEEAAVGIPRVEKKGKGKMVGILVALVLVLGAGAAGAVFAPRLLAKGSHAEKPAAAEGEEGAEAAEGEGSADEEHGKAKEGEEAAEAHAPVPAPGSSGRRRAGVVGEIVELAPIIVDIHATDNSIRHMKVQLVVEMQKTKTGEEFKKLVPFAREAAISYLRTQDFDKLSDPKSFDTVRAEIEAAVIEAVGKNHARRVLITDFVVQ
jgi:flagellar basal body-associated protein FliL